MGDDNIDFKNLTHRLFTSCYYPPTKFHEGNVFNVLSRMCLFSMGVSCDHPRFIGPHRTETPTPVQTCSTWTWLYIEPTYPTYLNLFSIKAHMDCKRKVGIYCWDAFLCLKLCSQYCEVPFVSAKYRTGIFSSLKTNEFLPKRVKQMWCSVFPTVGSSFCW